MSKPVTGVTTLDHRRKGLSESATAETNYDYRKKNSLPLDEYHTPKKLILHTGLTVKATSAAVSCLSSVYILKILRMWFLKTFLNKFLPLNLIWLTGKHKDSCI